MPSLKSTPFLIFTLLGLPYATLGDDCPCGYSVGNAVFTEALETDFTDIKDMNTVQSDWQVQDWTSPANAAADIPFSRVTQYSNTVAGGNDGLQLFVRGASDGKVGCSEIRTARDDMRHGSFRIAMKSTTVAGTCSAFFWYQDDAHEIDMEILSRELKTGTNGAPGPIVNLVIHSPESKAGNFDASKTNTFSKTPLGFDPTADFHDYRMDWTPDSVTFFIDRKQSQVMKENIPHEGGRIFLNHWSNGAKGWSGGPPDRDAVMWVRSFRGYFNSSDAGVAKAADDRCNKARAAGNGNVCSVGQESGAPRLTPPPPPASSQGASSNPQSGSGSGSTNSPKSTSTGSSGGNRGGGNAKPSGTSANGGSGSSSGPSNEQTKKNSGTRIWNQSLYAIFVASIITLVALSHSAHLA